MKHTTAVLQERKDAIERTRVKEYGPPPINVFKTVREDLNLSHDQLAKLVGVSKLALIRLEQGTFTEPLPKVVDYYVRNHGYSELWLVDDYEQYQVLMRKRHFKYFGNSLECDPFISTHPMRQLRDRNSLNPTEVAKALCIPQATLEHFEKKYKTQQSVPKVIINVLRDIGYTDSDVRQFCSDYSLFRKQNSVQLTLAVEA